MAMSRKAARSPACQENRSATMGSAMQAPSMLGQGENSQRSRGTRMLNRSTVALPSSYELNAVRELADWKNPSVTTLKRITELTSKPNDIAGQLIISSPAIGDAVRCIIDDVVLTCHEICVATGDDQAVYRKFQAAGHKNIRGAADIFDLDLQRVENVIDRLHVRYEAEAALGGLAGASEDAIESIADVPDLVALSLSAISQYRAHYGFAPTQYERMFAMHILGYSSGASVGAKNGALIERAKLTQAATQRPSSRELDDNQFILVIRTLAAVTGERLTKAKLAQITPAFTGLAGSAFNTWYVSTVCEAARFLYRERFLIEKYGTDIMKF